MEVVEKKRSMVSSEEDRLSNLPDDIIRHILSFLETKYAVRSSLLSKDWMFHWKHLRILNFDSQSFALLPPFKKFLSSVLRCPARRGRGQHQANNSAITKLRYASRSYDGRVVDRIVKYAVAHNVEHLIMEVTRKRCRLRLEDLSYQALKTLKLGGFYLLEPFPYSIITTMRLQYCSFCDYGDDLDVFAGCQSLKNLRLIYCKVCTFRERLFKITASQLIKLKIISSWFAFPRCKYQIFAPKLEYFGYNWDQAKVWPKSGDISQFVEIVSGNSQCRSNPLSTTTLEIEVFETETKCNLHPVS